MQLGNMFQTLEVTISILCATCRPPAQELQSNTNKIKQKFKFYSNACNCARFCISSLAKGAA